MEDLIYQTYAGLLFSQDIPLNTNFTTLDVIMNFFFGALLITALTVVLDSWVKEEIMEMEEEMRLLEHQLLKMGIVIKTIPT